MYRYDPLKWWHVDPVRRQRVKDLMVWFCVLLAFVAAYFAGSAAAREKKVGNCTVTTLGELLDAQNARAASAAETQNATDALDAEQLNFLGTVNDPLSTEQEKSQAFDDYVARLKTKVDKSNEQTEVRDDNPLPTSDSLKSCAY